MAYSPETFLIRGLCSLYKNECWDEEVSREIEIEIPVAVGNSCLTLSSHLCWVQISRVKEEEEGWGYWVRPCPLWSVILWRRTLTLWWTCLACSPRLYSPLEPHSALFWDSFLKDNGQQILAVITINHLICWFVCLHDIPLYGLLNHGYKGSIGCVQANGMLSSVCTNSGDLNRKSSFLNPCVYFATNNMSSICKNWLFFFSFLSLILTPL